MVSASGEGAGVSWESEARQEGDGGGGTARGLARICALAIVALCAAASIEAWRLESWTVDGAGPGLLPGILLTLIAITALYTAFAPGDPQLEGGDAPLLTNRNFQAYAVGMLGTPLLIPYLGYITAGFVAVASIMRFGEGQSWKSALVWATALTLSLTIIFGVALGVPFPPGPAENVLTKFGWLRAG
jgi:putative tricarboxylic transport membrane protein